METKICNRCASVLTEDNWRRWARIKNDYICKSCHNIRFKTRPKYKQQRKTNTVKKIFEPKLSLKITNLIMGAKKRGLEVSLTYAEIGELLKKPCTYCGQSAEYCGLDRVDSDFGYTHENVTPCCARCNYAKHVSTVEDFVAHCKKIVAHMEACHGR
jgi:hypothetical protein